MSGNGRLVRGNSANLKSQVPSPLPQEEAVPDVQVVRVTDAFFQFLPSQQLTFFQRAYFATYPVPLVVAGPPSYPRPVPVCRILAPKEQAVVIRHVVFRVYESTGLDPDDVTEVPAGRIVTSFGFQFEVGRRGTVDLNTNLTARGDIINYANAGKAFLAQGFAPTPGQGSFYPFAGSQQQTLDSWAYYARPGQAINGTVQVLRPPPFDTRFFSFEMGGFLLPENVLDAMLERRKGT